MEYLGYIVLALFAILIFAMMREHFYLQREARHPSHVTTSLLRPTKHPTAYQTDDLETLLSRRALPDEAGLTGMLEAILDDSLPYSATSTHGYRALQQRRAEDKEVKKQLKSRGAMPQILKERDALERSVYVAHRKRLREEKLHRP